MKKYVKPVLIYESFAMAQQIAACDYDLVDGSPTNSECRFMDKNGVIIFLDNCGDDGSFQVDGGGSICYHNSISAPIGIFNS